MKKNVTSKIVRTAVIAAIYSAVTLLLLPLSFSAIQMRVSEALTILPLLFPEAVIGVTVGCFISNLFSGMPLDILFGTLATLIASVLTFIIGKTVKNKYAKVALGALPPVLANAFIVPITLIIYGFLPEGYWFGFATVGLGQAIAVYAIGIPLYVAITKITERKNSQSTSQGDITKL